MNTDKFLSERSALEKSIREKISKQRNDTLQYYFRNHPDLYPDEVYGIWDSIDAYWVKEGKEYDDENLEKVYKMYSEGLTYKYHPKRLQHDHIFKVKNKKESDSTHSEELHKIMELT